MGRIIRRIIRIKSNVVFRITLSIKNAPKKEHFGFKEDLMTSHSCRSKQLDKHHQKHHLRG